MRRKRKKNGKKMEKQKVLSPNFETAEPQGKARSFLSTLNPNSESVFGQVLSLKKNKKRKVKKRKEKKRKK